MKTGIVNSSSFGKYFPEHLEKLSRLGEWKRFSVDKNIDGESLAKELQGVNFIIASVTPNYTKEFFEENKDVSLIARHGIGVNNVEVESATEAGVLITRVPGEMERDAVAEHTLALLLQVTRKINPAYQAVKEGRWKDRAKFLGIELKGKTVGIIGFGNIGSRVGEILKKGFCARVLAYDPKLEEETIVERGGKPVSLEELLKESDIITFHASYSPENYHILGKREFELMKEGVIIINTARGELIDQEALIRAIKSGKVAGVGMDVVEGEPIGADHPLLALDNVVIVPHIATYTIESLKRMGDKVVEDVEKVSRGKIPEGVVNPEVLRKENRAGLKL
ncbi:hydroxyacid dehydrogenase [Candidatus Calescamantes bacterium]|nr:hydroxyacid dehydrogenase [Candidatus Calescamantes bacterium]